MEYLKIVVFYGGDTANKPRDELINWLNSSEVSTILGHELDIGKVGEMTAHTDKLIEERVDKMINSADKAIVLLTPDERSQYGAVNAIDECVRFQERKGKDNVVILKHKSVPRYSNKQGEVYIKFEKDVVKEGGAKILPFLSKNSIYLRNISDLIDNCTHILQSKLIYTGENYKSPKDYLFSLNQLKSMLKELQVFQISSLIKTSAEAKKFDIKYEEFIDWITRMEQELGSKPTETPYQFDFKAANNCLSYFKDLEVSINALPIKKSDKNHTARTQRKPHTDSHVIEFDAYELFKAVTELILNFTEHLLPKNNNLSFILYNRESYYDVLKNIKMKISELEITKISSLVSLSLRSNLRDRTESFMLEAQQIEYELQHAYVQEGLLYRFIYQAAEPYLACLIKVKSAIENHLSEQHTK